MTNDIRLDPLLTREEFKRQVFARNSGRCLFCQEPADAAHHILERKLFADGGYYLSNGAGLCARHHWQCETTELSVAQVRQHTGAVRHRFPDGWTTAGVYDKWGNRLWPSGLRSWGPLEADTGARKALAAGGYLGVMMPSTYTEES